MQNGGIAALHIDITHMKLTEDQLRQSRDNLNRAQRLAKIGSFNRDFQTGEVSGSEEFYRIFGFDPQLPPPAKEEFLPLIHPDDRAGYQASMTASEQGLQTSPLTYRFRCHDGSIKWIYTEIETIFDDEGNPGDEHESAGAHVLVDPGYAVGKHARGRCLAYFVVGADIGRSVGSRRRAAIARHGRSLERRFGTISRESCGR